MRRATFGIRQVAIIVLVGVILFIMTLLFISLLNPGALSSVSFASRLAEVFK